MKQQHGEFCFCTLALGENYRNLALELAKDLEQYSPKSPLVILTDKPQHFCNNTNVFAFKHKQQSIGCYHDKRFAVAKGLSLSQTCIFVDADMRILAPIPDKLPFCQPGITAKIVWHNIVKHNKNQTEIQILQRITDKLDLDLKDISFVHECLFAVTKDQGRELEFLDTWERIAAYCELNKFYRGEGHAIGLAAAKIGWRVSVDPMSEICFFKDKLELDKIKSGDAYMKEKNAFFETQKKLEYPHMSLMNKFVNKSRKVIMYLYRSLRLKMFTLTDIDFYYK